MATETSSLLRKEDPQLKALKAYQVQKNAPITRHTFIKGYSQGIGLLAGKAWLFDFVVILMEEMKTNRSSRKYKPLTLFCFSVIGLHRNGFFSSLLGAIS